MAHRHGNVGNREKYIARCPVLFALLGDVVVDREANSCTPAAEHAPRFVRFFRMITSPGGKPVARTQNLVVQSLLERDGALLMFNDAAGRREREAKRDLVRGESVRG